MNELKIFTNEEFGTMRLIEKDGEPWFLGKEVAEILQYQNTRDALAQHVDAEDKDTVVIHDGTPGNPNQVIINESGLYSLILRSNLPKAKAFRRWVTSEILPSIRKHGAYATPETIDQILKDPDFGIRLLSELKAERDRNLQLTADNSRLEVEKQVLLPKADYFDEIVDRNLLTNFRETAKQLGIKEKAFIGWLLDHKYVYRDKRGNLMPYASKNDGLFEIKECFNDKTKWAGTQTLITPKGRETFRLLTKGL